MAESWSMEVKGIFRDVNLLTSLAKLKAEVRRAGEYIKSTTVEMKRMASEAKVLGGLLSLIGAGGFAALLMSAPRTAAALAKLKTWLELIFLILDEHLSPAVEWLADQFGKLYDWFKNLSPEWQKAISWAVAAGFAFTGLAVAIGTVNTVLKTLFGWSLVTWLASQAAAVWAFIAALVGPVGLAIALGLIAGALAVLVLDKIGVFDWFSDLGRKFREVRDQGSTLNDIITVTFGLFGLLGKAVLTLVGAQSWSDMKRDFSTWEKSLGNIASSLGIINNLGGRLDVETDQGGFGGKYDVGGMVSYTGLHWLKAGEQVSMQGASSSKTGAGGTTITNDFGGATFVLQNGLDIDDFVEVVSRKQAEKSAWSSF